MLKEINILGPFFEDCYRWISVREYARIANISPPTASKTLKQYAKERYLVSREERRHLLFSLNRENKEAIDLSVLYWKKKLEPVIEILQKKLVGATCILFGSLSKAEVTPDSDVDLAIIAPQKKDIDLKAVEKLLHRAITAHWFSSLSAIKNEHLLNNIINGTILLGRLRWP